MQSFRERTVRSDADRLAFGCIGDPLGMLVPVGFTETEPVHLAARLAIAVEILQSALGVAVLPGVEAGPFAALQQRADALGRVPVGHVLAEELVEMRVAINRIAADNQARDLVRSKFD